MSLDIWRCGARLNLKAELVAADPQAFLAKLRGEPEEDVGALRTVVDWTVI